MMNVDNLESTRGLFMFLENTASRKIQKGTGSHNQHLHKVCMKWKMC